ncbi:hypothetical protein SAMN05216505_106203 [Streptomyces prasinopilosus]|uniref:Uncharacterized protein n=1 Tax=Streptomyces prasinopilosus TaxID=67344 RepID=A0A1G6TJ05_9ACTN|nr:hypothetical protein SAMN05216505_106203 [Streptomyces prasinopilosus]
MTEPARTPAPGPGRPGHRPRAAVEEPLRRTGRGDPDRIAELYADPCDRPRDEHGDAATPWIHRRGTRADATVRAGTTASARGAPGEPHPSPSPRRRPARVPRDRTGPRTPHGRDERDGAESSRPHRLFGHRPSNRMIGRVN